jgi:hypothetical protein
MEDGSRPALALETHPQWIANGVISGSYNRRIALQGGDRLRLLVGFLQGAGAGNVTFNIIFNYPGCGEFGCSDTVAAFAHAYNGALVTRVTDLSAQNGRVGTFVLLVNAGASSGQDWATWVVAQVERP